MGNEFKSRDKFTTIIDAALGVFGEKGYYNATISEIARAAGVSEATIYEYFGSKEDLLFAIPGEITRQAVDFLEGMAPFIKGAKNKVRAIVYGYYRLYKDNPNYSSLVLLNLKHNRKFMDAEGYQAVKKAAGLLLEAIKEGMESGEFRSDIDPYLVRSMILGTIEHIFFRWHLKGRQEELPDFVEGLLEILTTGIGKPVEPRTYQINITLPSGPAPETPQGG
jgi:TetR/AcrR family fatty acid metabolism transcriptional regulator